jgi:hypothetical protein
MRSKFRLKIGGWGLLPLMVCLLSVGLMASELRAAVVKAEDSELASGKAKARQASPKPARWVTADHTVHTLFCSRISNPQRRLPRPVSPITTRRLIRCIRPFTAG